MEHQQWARVRGLEPLSLCDWPGHAVSVVFLGGCNLACPTCHNHHLAVDDPGLPHLGRKYVLDYLSSRKRWLDGIVVSGGEPTVDPRLTALLSDLALLGLPIKVDSNGMRPEVIQAVLDSGLRVTFAVDFKGPFAKYPELTGFRVSAEQAEERLSRVFALASRRPEAFYFRTTMVPLVTEQDLAAMRGLLPNNFSLILQDYVEPRRSEGTHDATSYSQAGRTQGDLGPGQDRPGHIEGPQGQWHPGPAPGQSTRP